MLTQSLINVAILVYFSVSSGHGIDLDYHARKKAEMKVEEMVVLVERPLFEKCVARSDVPALLPKTLILCRWNLDQSFPILMLHTKLLLSTVVAIIFRLTRRC